MEANIDEVIETTKELTEKQKSILNLASQFKQNLQAIVCEDNIQVDVNITVPEVKFQQWMGQTLIENEGLFIYINDDKLPF